MYISDTINNIAYDVSGKFLVTTGDRQIHVFHNVPGYEARIADLEDKKNKTSKSSTAAQKERINQQIEEARYGILFYYCAAVLHICFNLFSNLE